MSGEARREAARWLRYIDADLAAIRLALSADPPIGLVAGYHCQQAAEKIMKGLPVLHDQPFRRTHDLDELADGVLRMQPELRATLAPLRLLTAWGYMYRYPAFDEPAEPEPDVGQLRATFAALESLRDGFAALLRGGDEPAMG